jgi:hypothetical protein
VRAAFLSIAVLLCGSAWSQTARPVFVNTAYVTVFPTGASDVELVIALQRGIELVLCQAGLKPRTEGPASPSELKLSASLSNADFSVDSQKREITRECELTQGVATLPGGATVALPDRSLGSRAPMPGKGSARAASESFFVACGASFARSALDTLKDEIATGSSSCDEPPKKPAPRRKK